MFRSVMVGALGALSLSFALSPSQVSAETSLERGTYLVRGLSACGNCHTPLGGPMAGRELAGGFEFNEAPFDAVAPNITPDKETGVGNWTDAELVRAIREGKRPDGSTIGPPMPIGLYRGFSDTDVKAIVAYLRVVQPVRNKVKKSVYRIPLPPAYGPPITSVPDVPRGNTPAYGGYLAGPVAHCVECHTPAGPNGIPDFANKLGAGGFEFKGPWGTTYSANITPHKTDGIGRWTNAQIKRMVRTGVRPDGTRMTPPMAYGYYANASDSDLDAIITYLRTLKPLPSEPH